MSLRTFHLVFVTIAMLLFAFLVLWGNAENESGVVTLGVVGVVLTLIYGIYFLNKSKHLDN